jgi:serine protease DegS
MFPALLFLSIGIRDLSNIVTVMGGRGIAFTSGNGVTVARVGFGGFPLGCGLFLLGCVPFERRLLAALAFVATLDLAVLSVALKFLPVAPLGRSDQLRVGDVVLAIGNPLGLSHTVTHGIVSAVSRAQLGIAPVEDFIQTDAPINRGNSGGALVDSSGALVGINTAMVAKSLGVEGIGFAIPVNLVRGVLADIIDHGRVIRGWIGISPEDVADEQAQQLGLAQGGVVVANLALGSPGQQAGLLPGDLLLSVDGASPRGAQDVLGRISRHKPGSTVSLRVLRGHRTFEVEARATERPRAQRQQP